VIEPETLPSWHLVLSAKATASRQLSVDLYDLSSNDEEYSTPTNVAETTSGQSDHAAHLLTVATLHFNSPPAAPKNWGQINLYLNDNHIDTMEIGSTFRIPDITSWWRQQEETHSQYADLSNVAADIVSIIPHNVEVQSSFSSVRDVIAWRQSKTTGGILRRKVIER